MTGRDKQWSRGPEVKKCFFCDVVDVRGWIYAKVDTMRRSNTTENDV